MRFWIEHQRGLFGEPLFVVVFGSRRQLYFHTEERAARAIRLLKYRWSRRTELGRAAARRRARPPEN